MQFSPEQVARLQEYRTPFFFYDLDMLQQTLDVLKQASSARHYHVHYALKANIDRRALSMIQRAGFGADCVSFNEIKCAIEAGFAPEHIVFAGVGKTDCEIKGALEAGIHSFNCESVQEIEVINDIAAGLGTIAPVALRINPDLDAKTHRYITTGKDENKFGIHITQLDVLLERIRYLQNIEIIGIHFHIGSQITELPVFESLCLRVNELNKWFLSKNIALSSLNMGGGLGINYTDASADPIAAFDDYFSIFEHHLDVHENQSVHFELGRAIVANAVTLVGRVLYVKEGLARRFAILDAGMTELIRPALYQANHQIHNLTSQLPALAYDVVGPVCESADTFGQHIELPEVRRGDLLAICSAGAYGEVMASRYNLRDPASVVYSDELMVK